jgi:hypothetical protein
MPEGVGTPGAGSWTSNATWQNCRMMRARTSTGRTTPLAAASEGFGPRHRRAAALGVLALALASAVACSAPNNESGGNATAPAGTATAPAAISSPTGEGAASAGGSGAQRAAEPAPADPVAADVKAKVEAALTGTVAGGRLPATEQIRAALAGAGLAAETVEVTASRTPTGLAADAVEAAVRAGESCVVAQLRKGSVVVSALPALAEGGCLVGATG